ncbi:MAG TPA: hypothetical protein VNU72_12025 [Puia sp.]|jgi:hypothetical protein|nr:hypothetical protein [Puia sp.]
MNKRIRALLFALSVVVGYGVLMRAAFGIKTLGSVMSLSFFITVPFGMGYLTIFLSDIEDVKARSYRICAPWFPVLIFLAVTLVIKIEGWACWFMILPFFLLFSSLGGVLAGYFKLRRHRRSNRLPLSLLFLLPFVARPLENLISHIPGRYEAYTYTDIYSSPETIWSNVVRVREIPEAEDHGSLTRFLGFPRPIRAELDYAGVGGRRQAIFSKGLVFEEVVKEYEDQKRMLFSIRADPHAIPPTTMDEHVVIGGDYFDVLDGMYRLEKLGEGHFRLHLYSHFMVRTSFNFYAGWWAGLIMKDIQNNILHVIQTRCEGKL